MKIGVNAAPLLKPFTGIGQYTKNLFKNLAEIDQKNEYILVAHKDVPVEVRRIFPKNVKIVVLPERRVPHAGLRKTWWEQISLPKYFLNTKVDVAFFPYPSNPWPADWYKRKIKTVVTVHDCIPWESEKYRKRLLSKMYNSQTKKAVSNADVIFTVSEFSKKKIVDLCGVKGGDVHVVYNDAGEIYKKGVERAAADRILKNYGLKRGQFFLYCGGYDERKNVKYLVEEYLAGDFEMPLVLVGGKAVERYLYSSFDEISGSGVIKLGFVSEEELAALYFCCHAFVHLSREEGFNIPLLEAANSGAPLILSDIPVHHEVAEGGAIFVDISKEGAAVSAMKRGKFADSSKIAEKYSWKKSAQKVCDVLFS